MFKHDNIQITSPKGDYGKMRGDEEPGFICTFSLRFRLKTSDDMNELYRLWRLGGLSVTIDTIQQVIPGIEAPIPASVPAPKQRAKAPTSGKEVAEQVEGQQSLLTGESFTAEQEQALHDNATNGNEAPKPKRVRPVSAKKAARDKQWNEKFNPDATNVNGTGDDAPAQVQEEAAVA